MFICYCFGDDGTEQSYAMLLLCDAFSFTVSILEFWRRAPPSGAIKKCTDNNLYITYTFFLYYFNDFPIEISAELLRLG